MDPEILEMPTGASQNKTSLEMMDVDVQEERVTNDKQESEDVPHSSMTPVTMEF